MNYNEHLKFYPDFPIKGVNFVDIIPLLQDKDLFRHLIDDLSALCVSGNVLAPEARGFLFAAPMLVKDTKTVNVIPVRKKGKLPFSEGDLITVNITKEYGTDQVFYRLSDLAASARDGDEIPVTFFDDILATGGTSRGIAESLNGREVVVEGRVRRIRVTDFVFLVEIDGLRGRSSLEGIAPVKSLIHV